MLGYTYPRLHEGKNWFVDFFAFDPATGKMRRKKYMLDGIPKRASEEEKRRKLSRLSPINYMVAGIPG